MEGRKEGKSSFLVETEPASSVHLPSGGDPRHSGCLASASRNKKRWADNVHGGVQKP